METPACPLCEQVGTVQWLDEAYAYVCGECATIVADAPLDVVEQPEGVVPPPPRLPRWWVYDRASARHAHEQRRVRHATEMVQGAATRLGFAYAAHDSLALLDRALRQERAPPWGALASACLYATLRRDHRLVDVAAVATAMEQTHAAVAHACRWLRRKTALPLLVNDPALYLEAQLAYLEAHPDVLPRAVDMAHVRTMTTRLLQHICTYAWATSLEAPSLAYATIMHAIEGVCQRAWPVRAMASHAPQVSAHTLDGSVLVSPCHASVSTVLVRYAEIEKMLHALVEALPWVAQRPISKRERDRMRHAHGQRSLSRAEVAMYMSDAIEWAAQHPPPETRVWSQAFAARRSIPRSPDHASMAQRLGLHGPRIDALSDADVDARLFAPDELASYMRTPAEQARWAQLKGWDTAPAAPAPVPSPPPIKRPRLHGPTQQPMKQVTDGASDWDD